MSRRYLSPEELAPVMNARGRVEQLVHCRNGEVCWVEIRPSGAGVALLLHERSDQGGPECFDVYSFEALDADGDPKRTVFDTLEDALRHCEEHLGISRERFVGRGVLQDEYRERHGW